MLIEPTAPPAGEADRQELLPEQVGARGLPVSQSVVVSPALLRALWPDSCLLLLSALFAVRGCSRTRSSRSRTSSTCTRSTSHKWPSRISSSHGNSSSTETQLRVLLCCACRSFGFTVPPRVNLSTHRACSSREHAWRCADLVVQSAWPAPCAEIGLKAKGVERRGGGGGFGKGYAPSRHGFSDDNPYGFAGGGSGGAGAGAGSGAKGAGRQWSR